MDSDAKGKMSRRGCKIPILVAVLLAAACVCAEARQIVGMSGRQVSVPDTIRKIYGASPPATFMIYAMNPGLVAGVKFPFDSSEKQYLDPRLEKLPVIGGWFGQGRVTNLETLLRVRPDLVLIWMWKESAINEKIEQALKPLNIPVVYIALDSVTDYPAAFRFLGDLLGGRLK